MARGRQPAEVAPIGAPQLNRLDSLVPRIESAKAVSDDARSDIGNVYREAEEFGFHRKALKEAIRLRNMEPDKRNDYLSSLQAYCDYLKVWAQADLLNPSPEIPQAPADASDLPSVEQSFGGFNHESGRNAAHRGESADACPWAPGVKAHDTWLAGHAVGLQEIADGLVEPPTAAESIMEASSEVNGVGRKRRRQASVETEIPAA
jgi:uncharacterized protein (UPF0335 family)